VFTALYIFVFVPDEREIKFNDDARESKLQSMSFSTGVLFVSGSLSILERSVEMYSAQESKQETVNQSASDNLMAAYPRGQGGREMGVSICCRS
jgi:hypothetical protein